MRLKFDWLAVGCCLAAAALVGTELLGGLPLWACFAGSAAAGFVAYNMVVLIRYFLSMPTQARKSEPPAREQEKEKHT